MQDDGCDALGHSPQCAKQHDAADSASAITMSAAPALWGGAASSIVAGGFSRPGEVVRKGSFPVSAAKLCTKTKMQIQAGRIGSRSKRYKCTDSG